MGTNAMMPATRSVIQKLNTSIQKPQKQRPRDAAESYAA